MFHTPDWYHNVSLRLSEVIDDIDVNERFLLKLRRARLLQESIYTITNNLEGKQISVCYLGSNCEGTTTADLESDSDILFSFTDYSVIQDWAEWSPGNRFQMMMMMICDESTPPGYCYLQVIRTDAPLPETEEVENCCIKDKRGRVLFKNTMIDIAVMGLQRHGPSVPRQGLPGIQDLDIVLALPFKSWPQPARHWLEQVNPRWPTAAMKQYAATTDCFVVGTGSCVSENKDFLWRISTSLAERCLIFNLNITQIRCYILLKMLLKTFINLYGQKHISSYMCKTVILHCVQCKPSYDWKEDNILNCLIYCLSTLNECVLCGNCSHFIIPGNNLMAGKITAENKHYILNQISNLIQHTVDFLLGIEFDKLGQRLFMKLGILHDADYNAIFWVDNTATRLSIESILLSDTAQTVCAQYNSHLITIKQRSLETQIDHLLQTIANLVRYHSEGNSFEQKACRVLAPLFCNTLGSLMASYNIQQNNPVCPQALRWLSAGINSDVSSGRLKLASIFYCTGDMDTAASILRDTEERYNTDVVEAECGCYLQAHVTKLGFGRMSIRYNEEGLRYITAFCVTFLPSEINCIPKELQYELFRSTEEELLHRQELLLREKLDAWMDLAVVDSSPYLYFLQYKTFSNLQSVQNQQQALQNLLHVTIHEENLSHRETAWNLLGQCMEQENRPVDALQCYRNSLHVRQTNNVSRFHICRLLASLIAPAQENNLGLRHSHM